MELYQLEYFIAVARHGNFTQASRYLHLAQAALSEQIKKLEEDYLALVLLTIATMLTRSTASAITVVWRESHQ